ncbi:ATP-binding protein [Mucilaginibacter sp. PAMB04274]|uniref:ATP-binding protein n=1 Tax=Mucilaginibacter sp. PAMB04274 TaxID=3138568 RepID=UPI0031F62AB2
MSFKKANQQPAQTQQGQYSNRLSNHASEADHREFREDEPFFRQILESLEDYAIFTTDLEGHISSWNTGAENLLGYTEEEIIGQDARILFTAGDRQKKAPEKEMAGARKTGSSLDERYHVRKDGSAFFVSGKMFALKDEKGKLRGFTKVMRDITHVKVLQETITQAKAYAESIVDTAREPMLVLYKDFTVNTANRAFYKTFKVNKKDTEGRQLYELGNGQWNIPALKALLEHILPNDSSFNDYEVIQEFEKLGTRTMLLNARKLWRVGNHTEMILLAMEDITERKQADAFKNAFIGIASHELRGPVSSIKGYAQLLGKRAQKAEDKMAAGTLDKINRQTDKLTEIINHLLDISRIQSGKLQLDRVHFDLNSLTSGIIDEMQSETTTHQLIQQGTIPKDVYADKFRIGQVLTNLISNAIKYSPDTSKVMIKLSQDRNKTHGIVTVQDFGIGIPPEDQANLFQAFSRARNGQKKKIQGIGLGLHIAAEIIKEHGGKIWFESKLEEGSVFHFSLPLSA